MSDEYSEEIEKCVEVLRNHGVILYPTDTIWGLGCDATQPKAVQRVFDIKNATKQKHLSFFLMMFQNYRIMLTIYLRLPMI